MILTPRPGVSRRIEHAFGALRAAPPALPSRSTGPAAARHAGGLVSTITNCAVLGLAACAGVALLLVAG